MTTMTKTTVTLTVILPTHDRPKAAERSVASILAQTRLPQELIVVDDGASPVGEAIGRRVAEAGVKFHYQRRALPSLPASRNRGVALASSDIIVFTEDDVVLPPDYLMQLARLYESDSGALVGGIGAVVVEPDSDAPGRRLWEALARSLGQGRWTPRRCASRYLSLPDKLRGKLVPARRLSGGAMSLRRSVARAEPFEEAFGGYALGEDREYSFRVGRLHALFIAPALRVCHERAPQGRPDMLRRGRMYVLNSLHIARHSTDRGAGTSLLVAYDFAGMIVLYSVWGLLRPRRQNLQFAAGMITALAGRLCEGIRELLLGS